MLISKCRHNLSAGNQAKNEKALLHRIELALLWCLDAFESSLLNGLECMKRNWEISICVCTFLDSRCVTKSLLENMEFLLRDQNLCKNFFFWLFDYFWRIFICRGTIQWGQRGRVWQGLDRAPLTILDLLIESYSQWHSPQPPHFSNDCIAPVRMYITIDFRSELSRSSVFIPSILSGFFCAIFLLHNWWSCKADRFSKLFCVSFVSEHE